MKVLLEQMGEPAGREIHQLRQFVDAPGTAGVLPEQPPQFLEALKMPGPPSGLPPETMNLDEQQVDQPPASLLPSRRFQGPLVPDRSEIVRRGVGESNGNRDRDIHGDVQFIETPL